MLSRWSLSRGASRLIISTLLVAPLASRAEVFNYTINQSQSQINLTASGSIFGGALVVTEQQANAITRYNGTIVTDVTVGGPSFVGGSSANAVNPTGLFNIPLQYSPNINGAAGTAPANYGVNLVAPVAYDIPAFTIPPEILALLPPPLDTLIPSNIDFGVLSSVVAKVALRDISLDVTSGGRIPTSGGTFDSALTEIAIMSGAADINLAVRLTQSDLLTKALMQTILTALASAFPDLGLTVTSPGLFSLDIDLGFGFRVDLSGLPAVPNTAATDGTITGIGGPPGVSQLTLPVQFAAISGLESIIGPELADLIGLDLMFDFSGTLRASATIPEASSVVLSSIAGILVVGAAIRRRRLSASK